MKTGMVLSLILLASCSSDPTTGTGSQTGNSIIAGRIATGDSTTPAGTQVFLRPLDWTPSQTAATNALQSTTTDSAGSYVFRNVPTTVYRIEARLKNHGWSKTVWAIPGGQAVAPTGILAPVGSLHCEISLNDTIRGGLVEMYGLNQSFQLPDTGRSEIHFEFDSLPVGLQTVRIWSHKSKTVIADLPIRVGPDSVSKVEYEQWGHDVHGPREDD